MWESYMGEVRYFGFNFVPYGWAYCDGTLLEVTEYPDLFMLIGTQYGGDGSTNFALPNLSGSVPIHEGTGTDLPARRIGSKATLRSAEDPQDPARTIGTLTLNACICIDGIYPSPS